MPQTTLFGSAFGPSSPYKAPVKAASTANITLASFTSGSTIDDVTVYSGESFLAKNQTDTTENGVYVCSGGSYAPTRRGDFDTASSMVSGALIPVQQGTANGNELWMHTTDGTIVVGTTSLTFAQV